MCVVCELSTIVTVIAHFHVGPFERKVYVLDVTSWFHFFFRPRSNLFMIIIMCNDFHILVLSAMQGHWGHRANAPSKLGVLVNCHIFFFHAHVLCICVKILLVTICRLPLSWPLEIWIDLTLPIFARPSLNSFTFQLEILNSTPPYKLAT